MEQYEKYPNSIRRFQYEKAIIKRNPHIHWWELQRILDAKFGMKKEKTVSQGGGLIFMKLHTEIKIDAAHHLPNYEGKCNQLHGHTWKVVVEIEGIKNPQTGMIVDFVEIKKIVNEFDHGCINDFIQNPTAENIVDYFLDKFSVFNFPKITIRVYESENSYIEGTR